MKARRRPRANRAALILAMMASGCAQNRPTTRHVVFVDWVRLSAMHPAFRALDQGKRPAAPDEPARPSTRYARGLSEEELRPFDVGAAVERMRRYTGPPAYEERIQLLATRASMRIERHAGRRVGLDLAAMEAARATAYREAEARAAEREAPLLREASQRMRALELRQIGLETQVGSLAAGPQSEVLHQLAVTVQERKEAQKRLRTDIARIRSEEYQQARLRLEEAENARIAQREAAIQAETAELARAVRSYREATVRAVAEVPELAYSPARRGVRMPPLAAAPSPTTTSSDATPSNGEVHAPWLSAAVRDDALRRARYYAREERWELALHGGKHLPDRTTDLQKYLGDLWKAR